MLTAKTQYNLTNAREYFEEHLCVGDYYDEGQRVSGQWIGIGAEQLGLTGNVRAVISCGFVKISIRPQVRP
jgi:hypothetical protein